MATKATQHLQLDLPVLLPNAPGESDKCVDRLVTELSGREGMYRVHVEQASSGKPPKLCIHYDPEVLNLGRVREIAQSVGARLTERFACQRPAYTGPPGVGINRPEPDRRRAVGVGIYRPARSRHISARP
jgi:hypothetical protein